MASAAYVILGFFLGMFVVCVAAAIKSLGRESREEEGVEIPVPQEGKGIDIRFKF